MSILFKIKNLQVKRHVSLLVCCKCTTDCPNLAGGTDIKDMTVVDNVWTVL